MLPVCHWFFTGYPWDADAWFERDSGGYALWNCHQPEWRIYTKSADNMRLQVGMVGALHRVSLVDFSICILRDRSPLGG